MLRILAVWLVSLSVWVVWFAGARDFLVAFATYGLIWSAPALVILLGLAAVERHLEASGQRHAAVVLGPAAGLLVVLLIDNTAPHAGGALWPFAALCLGVGCVWMLSFLQKMASER